MSHLLMRVSALSDLAFPCPSWDDCQLFFERPSRLLIFHIVLIAGGQIHSVQVVPARRLGRRRAPLLRWRLDLLGRCRIGLVLLLFLLLLLFVGLLLLLLVNLVLLLLLRLFP